MLISRLPDKPYQRSPSSLVNMSNDYIATYKYDGWRCMAVIDGGISFYSRNRNKLPINDNIAKQVLSLGLPNGTVLDTEWMARRAEIKDEVLYLITVMWLDGKWVGNADESTRWSICSELKLTENIKLPEHATASYNDLFNSSKLSPITEGIVLKHKNSKLIGDMSESKKNGMWIKIKWREGNDGKFIR